MEKDPIILEFYDVCLRSSDVVALNKGEWFTDTDIEFFYEYVDRFFFMHFALCLAS